VLYLNPGSASQGRGRPRSVAVVTVYADGRLEYESIEIA
jgi:predicted phosphodiesterase